MNPLSNARHPGESFKNYKARRRIMAKVVKSKLRGRLIHAAPPTYRKEKA